MKKVAHTHKKSLSKLLNIVVSIAKKRKEGIEGIDVGGPQRKFRKIQTPIPAPSEEPNLRNRKLKCFHQIKL
jgi:hypothetical protein